MTKIKYALLKYFSCPVSEERVVVNHHKYCSIMLFVKYATIITTGSELAKEKFNNLLNMSDKGGVSY